MEQESSVRNSSRPGTRERIVEAAFSFYGDFVFEKVSLSRIADRVGISKPAIFKHFKKKDALLEEMDERVFSHLTTVLQDMDPILRAGRLGDALSLIIGQLARNREETFYLFSTLPGIKIDSVLMRLRERGVRLFDDVFAPDGSVKDKDRYLLTVFTSSTFLYFLLLWFSSSKGDECGDASLFIEKLNSFIQEGLEGLECLSDFGKIDEACDRGMSAARPVNRAFTALVSVIGKKGLQGVTVEAIAGELGLAKSSLYSSFRSKDDMLASLVSEELSSLYATVLESVRGLEGYGGRIYAIMRTCMLYFIARPGILSIFKGIVLSGMHPLLAKGACGPELEALESMPPLVPALPDLGIRKFDGNLLLSWFFSLPAMLYLHCQGQGWDDEEMLLAVRVMYGFLSSGISGTAKGGAL